MDDPESETRELGEQSPLPGDQRRIGPYVVRRVLGEGGMGVVYEAEQRHPIHRVLALKLLKTTLASPHARARFEAERQALALMEHPNIARVYDAATTESGQPYFAMEYVRGEPITTYCDRHRLGLRERLDLFVQVCEGVQHSHQKGVLHRDLKPSNILVTVQDDRAVPKIIDFGVAKALTHRLTERTIQTEFGQLVGTPDYMSPEQAEMTGLDVDTRTDVYSLGVLLYELLTGVLPFDRDALRRCGFDELRRTIRDVEPPRPSRRLTSLGEGGADLAAFRRLEPAALARALESDLDAIVMKALEKDRTRRYSTPLELAADIGHHLRHEPVSARAPSTRYRLRKFVRRHRWGVGAAAALGVAALLGFAGTVTGLLRAQRAEARALEEAQTATQVTDFLVRLFAVADPGEARGSTVTAREVLDAGASRIDAELSAQPAVRARLLRTMGRVYENLGLMRDAGPLFERALAAQRSRRDPDPRQLADALQDYAWFLRRCGEYREALPLAEEALALRERAGGPRDTAVAGVLATLATIQRDADRLGDARRSLERAIAIREAAGETDTVGLGYAHYQLGWTLKCQGRPAEAREPYARALAIMRKLDNSSGVAWCLSDLGVVNGDLGNQAEAERLLVEALALRRRILPPEHPDIAATLNNLGAARWASSRYREAIPPLEEALAIRQKTYGPDNADVAGTVTNLALVHTALADYRRALPLAQRALAILERVHGGDHTDVATARTNLADIYARLGRRSEALAAYERAIPTLEARLGPDHPSLAPALRGYAAALAASGRRGEAEALMERVRRLEAKR
jgi:non-specific serine/threonine protein kinase/serine/threonine-protein kinase